MDFLYLTLFGGLSLFFVLNAFYKAITELVTISRAVKSSNRDANHKDSIEEHKKIILRVAIMYITSVVIFVLFCLGIGYTNMKELFEAHSVIIVAQEYNLFSVLWFFILGYNLSFWLLVDTLKAHSRLSIFRETKEK